MCAELLCLYFGRLRTCMFLDLKNGVTKHENGIDSAVKGPGKPVRKKSLAGDSAKPSGKQQKSILKNSVKSGDHDSLVSTKFWLP